MTEAYNIWKTLHILSAAILFGTGLGIAFFAWFGYRMAMKSNAIEGLRTVLRLTVLGDLYFTTPAVIFQPLSGLMLMHLQGWPWWGPWATTVYCLYVLVGLCWVPVVFIQIALSREARMAPSAAALSERFHRRFHLWFGLGIPAFLLVLVIFYLMVLGALPSSLG